MTANIPNNIRRAVYRRDHFSCALCDSTDGIQIHHAIPRGEGGSRTKPENLITLCWRCHAFIHQGYTWCMGDQYSSVDAAEACVEYLADLYTTDDHLWNPWDKSPWDKNPLE